MNKANAHSRPVSYVRSNLHAVTLRHTCHDRCTVNMSRIGIRYVRVHVQVEIGTCTCEAGDLLTHPNIVHRSQVGTYEGITGEVLGSTSTTTAVYWGKYSRVLTTKLCRGNFRAHNPAPTRLLLLLLYDADGSMRST